MPQRPAAYGPSSFTFRAERQEALNVYSGKVRIQRRQGNREGITAVFTNQTYTYTYDLSQRTALNAFQEPTLYLSQNFSRTYRRDK